MFKDLIVLIKMFNEIFTPMKMKAEMFEEISCDPPYPVLKSENKIDF